MSRVRKKGCVFAAIAGLLIFLYAPLTHAETPIAGAVSGDEMTLSKNQTVRLEGIKAPLPGEGGFAEQARTTLDKLIAGKKLALENVSTDRYGRTAAEVFVIESNGTRTRLQETMLREGLAFVYPPTGFEPGLNVLFTAENEARMAKRGIWADDAYADTPDENAHEKSGHFAFVRGKVTKATRTKDKVYLDFSDKDDEDFTIIIAAHDLAAFRKAGIDPFAYEGKIVRVRGWVAPENGQPAIVATTPAQIQIITKP